MFNNLDSILGYGKHIMDEFSFESGDVLKDVEVEYYVSGTPKYDDEGAIKNAIIYCHKFNGNCSSYLDEYSLAREGEPFDGFKFCFISITTLGYPNSCSPSTTGLKHDFPRYTVKDRVNFKRQFLKDKFNMDRVQGIAGRGSGGYEVYTWACEYPDEMDFIIIGDSAFKTNGYRYVIAKAIDGIIESSDDFYKEGYSETLSKMMVSIYRLLYSNYFSKQIFQEMSNDEIDVLMDDFVDEGLFTDIYDFKIRNECIQSYNVEDKLKNIKAKTLIISSTDDLYFSPDLDSVPLEDLIENSKVILFESQKDRSGYESYRPLVNEFNELLKDFK
ncbi:MAG: homoserine acetyltransferase [Methanobrevibacter sp.]|nr:homoserine acetyltransferase [Methanobrevibacter sp.]